MKIKILKNTVAAKKLARAGDVLDLDDTQAKFLIHIGKAAKYVEEIDATGDTADNADEIETEHAPRKRRKSRA